MDGSEYISAFVLPKAPEYEPGELISPERVAEVINSGLADTVVALYFKGAIHDLADEAAPVVTLAREELAEIREVEREGRKQQKIEQTAMRRQNPRGVLRIAPASQIDPTHTFSDQRLADISEMDKTNVHTGLVGYSLKALYEAVSSVSHITAKGAYDDAKVAKAVKDTVSNERLTFGRVMHNYRGVITIEHDFNSTDRLTAKDKVGMRVKVVRPHDRHTPNWMERTDQWGDPLGLLCSAITEAETLLVLQEWVIARGLPYIPISAPSTFEDGVIFDTTAPSFNADILLCSMVPGRNEIIPVQVKNYVDHKTREAYSDNVVLVSPRHLGMERAERQVVAIGSRQRMGTRLTVTYGKIMESYFAIRSGGKSGRQTTPSRAEREAFSAALQPGFEHFDREIGDRIKKYTQELEVVSSVKR
jgi:hypothetical protein